MLRPGPPKSSPDEWLGMDILSLICDQIGVTGSSCRCRSKTGPMHNRTSQAAAGAMVMATVCCSSLSGQILPNDFSSRTNVGRLMLPSNNRLIPDDDGNTKDLDRAGSPGSLPAFYANAGDDKLRNPEQNDSVLSGSNYEFQAGMDSAPYRFNLRRGTLSGALEPTAIASYSLDWFSGILPKRGSQFSSIYPSGGWGLGGLDDRAADLTDGGLVSPMLMPLVAQPGDDKVVLTWTNSAYVLQRAPLAEGVYTNILGAESPYTNPITGSQMYFRLTPD